MPKNTKYYISNYLKEATTPEFTEYYKQVLFNAKLSYGCRIWLFSQATLPRSSEYSDQKLGRKLTVDGRQIRRWRKEANENKIELSFRPLP